MKFGLSDADVEKIHTVLRKFPRIKTVVIYGSRALKRERPGSDIDLTLEGDDLNLDLILALRTQLDDTNLHYLFDISIRAEIENPAFLEHINRVGQIFYLRN